MPNSYFKIRPTRRKKGESNPVDSVQPGSISPVLLEIHLMIFSTSNLYYPFSPHTNLLPEFLRILMAVFDCYTLQ